jgi:hypothetical protein
MNKGQKLSASNERWAAIYDLGIGGLVYGITFDMRSDSLVDIPL